MSKGPVITNYMEIDGVKKRLDNLSEDQRKTLAEQLKNQMMRTAGYKKTHKENSI